MSDDADEPNEPDEEEREAPLSDLAREVRERRERKAEGEVEDDLFEKVDVGDVDSEAVWEAVVEDEAEEKHLGVGREAEQPAAETDRGTEHVVSKREYCQRCPHFTDPPEVACDHEGTRIVEVVDSDTFRVRNCPMISNGRKPPQFE